MYVYVHARTWLPISYAYVCMLMYARKCMCAYESVFVCVVSILSAVPPREVQKLRLWNLMYKIDPLCYLFIANVHHLLYDLITLKVAMEFSY